MPAAPDALSAYRLAAVDLDGTLLGPDKTVSPANRAALARLADAGLEVVLASGRHRISMLPIAEQLPEVRWMVSAQGAFVSDLAGEQIVLERSMPPERAAEAMQICLHHHYPTIFYAPSGIFTLSEGAWIDRYGKLSGIRPALLTEQEALRMSVFKVLIYTDAARVDAFEQLPEVQAWDLYRVRSLDNVFEFAGADTDKGQGLAALGRHLDIDPSVMIGFGDAPNDLPMMDRVGLGVAMDHAWREVKVAADRVAPQGPPETSFARAVELVCSGR